MFHTSMAALSHVSRSGFSNLANQPWFPDHVTDKERAWIVGLQYFATYTSYERPIEEYFIDTRTITVDNSREIDIWIIKETPFNPEHRLLDRIEQFVRISEDFLGVPFPTNDIVFTVTGDYNYVGFGTFGVHLNDYFMLHESYLDSLEHEMAHYYLNSSFGNRWQVEGGADFMSAYVNSRTGRESIENHRSTVSHFVKTECMDRLELHTIHQLNEYLMGAYDSDICAYRFGDLFLLDVLAIVGETAMGRSLGEIYTTAGLYHPATDEELYRTLLRNSPEESRDALRELYRRFTVRPSRCPHPNLRQLRFTRRSLQSSMRSSLGLRSRPIRLMQKLWKRLSSSGG